MGNVPWRRIVYAFVAVTGGLLATLLLRQVATAFWTALLAPVSILFFVVMSERSVMFDVWDMSLVGALCCVLVAVAGRLWAALLLRQVAATFGTVLLASISLEFFLFFFALLPPGERMGIVMTWTPLGLYSLLGILWSRRLFLRAEDAGWIGLTKTLPVWRISTAWSQSASGARRRSPLAALIGKELQLHHATLFCAVGLLACISASSCSAGLMIPSVGRRAFFWTASRWPG